MIYRFECDYTDDDYYLFNEYHMLKSPEGKKGMLYLRLIMPLMLFVQWIYDFFTADDTYYLAYSFGMYLIASVVWYFGIKKVCLLLLKIGLKRKSKKRDNSYCENAVLEFDESFFEETTSNATTKVKYEGVYRVAVNPNEAVYIYQNRAVAFIVPFRCFKTDEEKTSFLEFIQGKTDNDEMPLN